MLADLQSDIPDDARSRVTHRHPGGRRQIVKFFTHAGLCGIRTYYANGTPESEQSYREEMRLGMQYEWYESGAFWSAAPYVDGLPHGTARQWSVDGRPLGTYTMDHGTGIDLWRQERADGSVYLSEARFLLRGKRHGLEWFINEDQQTVYIERTWRNHRIHGIEREWDAQGRLGARFPKFHVGAGLVDKRRYVAFCEHNLTLPAFHPSDDSPQRVFPTEVARALLPPRS